MKGRIFWLVLFLIGLSWILNSYYAYSKRLDEPIFLDHYIEQSVHAESENYLTLYYLTNVNDDSHLSHVSFGGITGYVSRNDFFDDFGFNYENEVNPDMQTYTHYALRNILVELNPSELEEVLKENGQVTIHDMDLFFSDGRDVTVPIGDVVLRQSYPFENPLEQSSSTSGDNWNSFTFRADEALTIDSVEFNFYDVIKDHFFIKIKTSNTVSVPNQTQDDLTSNYSSKLPGIEISDFEFPFELKKDESFKLYTQISPDFIGSLESSILITGATENGKPFTSQSLINNREPYLEQKDVDRIIREKRKGGSR